MGERLGLSGGQMVSCLVQGAVLWLVFALLLRWLGPMGIYEGGLKAAIYLLAIPLTVPVVFQVERLAKLRREPRPSCPGPVPPGGRQGSGARRSGSNDSGGSWITPLWGSVSACGLRACSA